MGFRHAEMGFGHAELGFRHAEMGFGHAEMGFGHAEIKIGARRFIGNLIRFPRDKLHQMICTFCRKENEKKMPAFGIVCRGENELI